MSSATSRVWYLAAAAGGCLWALCFGREPATVASWVGLVPLFLLLGGPRPGRLAWAHGVAFWLVAIPWIAPTLESFGRLPAVLSWLLLLLLAAYLGLYHALFAVVGARLWARPGAAPLVGLAGFWVALEWVRGFMLGGFPWNSAGYAWVDQPGALALASWVGIAGVSFLLVLANGAVARTIATGRGAGLVAGVPLCFLVLVAAGRWAGPAMEGGSGVAPGAGLDVQVVQPNTPNQVEYDPERTVDDYARLLEMSRAACEPGGLVIWPESAAWPWAYDRHEFLRRDLAELAERGCSVLFNSVSHEGEEYFNSALLVGAEGVTARYDKLHLVPFGEYVPSWISWLPFVGKIARQVGSFSPGREARLVSVGREALGVSICFESIFSGQVAASVRDGATLLVTMTNDAWYGDSSAPWQHFRAARFRAAENRRPLVRAAVTGVSARIDATGGVVEQLGVFEEGRIGARLAGGSDLTLYTRWPWLSTAGCLLVAAFAIFAAVGRPR